MTDKDLAGRFGDLHLPEISDNMVDRLLAITEARVVWSELNDSGVLTLSVDPVIGRLFAYQGALRVAITLMAVGFQTHPKGGVILHALELATRKRAAVPFDTERQMRAHLDAHAR